MIIKMLASFFFSEVRERLYSDKEINQGMSDEKRRGGGRDD